METKAEKLAQLCKDIPSLQLSYNKISFLVFLVLFFLLYFCIRSAKGKQMVILAGNLVFYLWNGVAAFVIVLATAAVLYGCSRMIEKRYSRYEEEKNNYTPKEQVLLLKKYKRQTIWWTVAAIFLILGIWIYTKAGRLAGLGVTDTFAGWIQGRGILVPLGISYYTLAAVGYLLDVYWRKTKAEHNFFLLFTCMTYFPHIVQGPIARYDKMILQVVSLPAFDYNRVVFGLQLMLWGYMKKWVVADRLAVFTQTVFAAPQDYAGVQMIVAVVFSLLQIYTDFSGCMDIVRGISQAVGIELEQNFRQPFFAKSAAEYWRRWHITLGAWFKDYIYMPIYMNPWFLRKSNAVRKKYGKAAGQLFTTVCISLVIWLCSGLWHGTGWNYMIWGLYWYVWIVLEEAAGKVWVRLGNWLHLYGSAQYDQILQMMRIFLTAAVGRMLTITDSPAQFLRLWKSIYAQLRLWSFFDGSFYTCGLDQKDFQVMIAGILIVFVVDLLHERGVAIRKTIAGQLLLFRWAIYYAAVFAVILCGMYGPSLEGVNFLYGNF